MPILLPFGGPEFQALLPCPKANHAGHFIENPGLAGTLLPGPSPAYVLPILVNRLNLDPTYPKDPKTLGEYIRKYRMDKGLLIRELAVMLGVTEDTVINWEVRGRRPTHENMTALSRLFPGFAT